MWIGAIKLRVYTGYQVQAGTTSLVEVSFRRDGEGLIVFPLEFPPAVGIDRASHPTYAWSDNDLPRRNDKTPSLPSGEVQIPMPYPDHGFEFSDGVKNHFDLRLRIRGQDEWVVEEAELWVKHVVLVNWLGLKIWQTSSQWSKVGEWNSQTWLLSTDPPEGDKTADFKVA